MASVNKRYTTERILPDEWEHPFVDEVKRKKMRTSPRPWTHSIRRVLKVQWFIYKLLQYYAKDFTQVEGLFRIAHRPFPAAMPLTKWQFQKDIIKCNTNYKTQAINSGFSLSPESSLLRPSLFYLSSLLTFLYYCVSGCPDSHVRISFS